MELAHQMRTRYLKVGDPKIAKNFESLMQTYQVDIWFVFIRFHRY